MLAPGYQYLRGSGGQNVEPLKSECVPAGPPHPGGPILAALLDGHVGALPAGPPAPRKANISILHKPDILTLQRHSFSPC